MSDQKENHAGRVSVIVPSYNRADVLARVLAGFENQTLPHDRFEVIVVDDGSTDGTADRVAAYRSTCPYALTFHQQSNRGPAAARNQGLAIAQGDLIVFVDDDCLPEPGLLAEHVSSHTVEGLAVIGPIIWHPDTLTTPFMRYIDASAFLYSLINVPFDAPFITFFTGNASIARAVARAIGGFDEEFPRALWEDFDFAYRLRQHGVRLVYNEHAQVLHYRQQTFQEALEREILVGRELVRFWAKHPELDALMPVAQMVDPAVQQRFYEVVTAYYQRLGVQEALGNVQPYDPGETLPARFRELTRAWANERLDAIQVELAQQQRRTSLLERENQALLRAYRELEAAYARQTAWASDLEGRLKSRPVSRPAALARRLFGWTRTDRSH